MKWCIVRWRSDDFYLAVIDCKVSRGRNNIHEYTWQHCRNCPNFVKMPPNQILNKKHKSFCLINLKNGAVFIQTEEHKRNKGRWLWGDGFTFEHESNIILLLVKETFSLISRYILLQTLQTFINNHCWFDKKKQTNKWIVKVYICKCGIFFVVTFINFFIWIVAC